MATKATNVVAIRNPIHTVKGRDKARREAAYCAIAINAFLDSGSRAALIASVNAALGKAPTPADIEAAKRELRIGRVVSRLAASEFPVGCTSASARTDWAREQLDHYAAHDAKRVTPKQKGRRGAGFDKALAPTREYVSQIMADVGASNAQTQKQKNDKKQEKRVTNDNALRGDGKGAKDSAKPTHNDLVKAPAPMTEDEACQFVMTQASTLLGYANKNAKHLPTDFGMAIQAFKKAINTAENDRQVRIAAREADAKKSK